MTKKDFLENYYKIYQRPEDEAFVFKIPSVLFLSEEISLRCSLSIPVMPDTLIGIRQCYDDTIYIREIDSEILYSAKKEELGNYDTDKKIRKIFSYINSIVNKVNFNGLEILVYENALKKEEINTELCIGYGIFKMFDKKKEFFLDLKKRIKKLEDVRKRAIITTSFIEKRGRCCYYDEEEEKIFSLNFSGAKIVVAKFSYEKNKSHIFVDGCSKNLADALRNENIGEFLKVLNKECELYKNNTPKNSLFRDFYDLCPEKIIARGIYEDEGMFLIIKNEDVDSVIKKIGEEYEKLRRERPEFYILDNSYAN